MSNSTITLQNIVNLASTQADLLPIAGVGGYSNEPALSLCNDVLQELMAPPFEWKFNRTELPFFVTAPSRQDYLFAGAVAFTLGSTSRGVGIDLATNNGVSRTLTTVTVTTLQPHNFSVGDVVYMAGNGDAQFNSTLTQSDTSGSAWSGGWTITAVTSTTFQFTHATSGTATSGAPGITNWRWGTSVSMTQIGDNSYPQRAVHPEFVDNLPVLSRVGDPDKWCMLQDLGTGVLKFRASYVPSSTAWAVNVVYQAKAPLAADLTGTWAPFPDEFSYVYRQGFLAHAYRYINSPRADAEYAKFQQKIQKALGEGNTEMDDTHIVPDRPILDDSTYWYY